MDTISMTATGPIAGIVLAAGMSKRFGQPKQLLQVGGEFIINRVVDAALNSRLDKVSVVLGHHHHEIQTVMGDRLKAPRCDLVINPEYHRGLSRSLNYGVRAIRSDYAACMFLLADQPLLDAATINQLIERFQSSDKGICVPLCRGKRKNPTLFAGHYFDRLLHVTGDTGARAIIDAQPEKVLFVEIDQPDTFQDVDTPEDLARIEALFQKSRKVRYQSREDHQDDHT